MDAKKRQPRVTISNARKARGLSQCELAGMVEISQQALAKIESGATARPSRDILERIAIILDIPFETLLLGDDIAALNISEAGARVAREYDLADKDTQAKIMLILISQRQQRDREQALSNLART